MRVVAGGKVVLLGEYAVLDGAPAWVAAVDRGVQCTVHPSDVLRIDTPTGDDRFARAALEAVAAPPAHYQFTDWRPVPSATKAGLGGSAAATVAGIVAGLGAQQRTASPAEVHTLAHQVHHAVQGSGSGIDVAAAAWGGVLRFTSGRVEPGPALVPTVVFSGQSAATGPRVQRYLAHADRTAFVEQSRALAEAFPTNPIPVLREAGRLLRAMAEAATIAYWTPGIDELVALAHDHGGAAKPSGAGGGDIVIALFPDPAADTAYREAAAKRGYLPIDVGLAPGAHRASS